MHGVAEDAHSPSGCPLGKVVVGAGRCWLQEEVGAQLGELGAEGRPAHQEGPPSGREKELTPGSH